MGFVNELKRRNVIRVAVAYAAIAWLVLQVAGLILETYGAPVWIIRTITTIIIAGFPITLVLAWFFELTPEGVKRDSEVADDGAEPLSHRRFDIIIIGMLSAAVAFLILDNYIIKNTGNIGKSIAVLPFVNMSSDKEQDYFSDGITEEILNALARVNELKVAGRTSSFSFKGKNEDLRLIGETLGVAHVLEGSVRKSGNKIRVTAQLIKVADGFHMWSQTYDRELTDIFAIQDEIAGAILKQLKAKLLKGEHKKLAATPTDDEVYNLYLQAKQRIYARTQPMLESAAQLLDQALAIDPDYAPAWAQRGITELLLAVGNYGEIPVAQALTRSMRQINRALELNPDLAEGWAGLGLYYLTRQDAPQEAIDALRKAHTINPNLVNASNWLKNAFIASGDIEEASRIAWQMADKDPLFRPGFTAAVSAYNRFGEEGKALELINRVKRLIPGDPVVLFAEGATHLNYGRITLAYPLLEESLRLVPSNAAARLYFSSALRSTYQIERLAAEGSDIFRADALDHMGKHQEAGDLALALSANGTLLPLLLHYNRTAQSATLVALIERKWTTLEALAQAYPGNVDGYELMTQIALAFQRTGDTPRFADALSRVAEATLKLEKLGVDNPLFHRNRALYYALADDTDSAIAALAVAIETGYRELLPLTSTEPAFALISSDPRFGKLERQMLEAINRDRQALGLGAPVPE